MRNQWEISIRMQLTPDAQHRKADHCCSKWPWTKKTTTAVQGPPGVSQTRDKVLADQKKWMLPLVENDFRTENWNDGRQCQVKRQWVPREGDMKWRERAPHEGGLKVGEAEVGSLGLSTHAACIRSWQLQLRGIQMSLFYQWSHRGIKLLRVKAGQGIIWVQWQLKSQSRHLLGKPAPLTALCIRGPTQRPNYLLQTSRLVTTKLFA